MPTNVSSGAVLEINMTGKTIGETLNLSSMGFGNLPTGGLKMIDPNSAADDTNSWTGQIHLGGSAAINVGPTNTVPGAHGDTLNQGPTGFMSSVAFNLTNLTKLGQGTLEMSGTSSNMYQGNTYLNEGKLLLNKLDIGVNETQTLTLNSAPTGPGNLTTTLQFGGISATAPLTITPEVQLLNLSGTSGGNFTPSFNNVPATFSIQYQTANNPTPGLLQQALETIPALAGNVTVSGANGGPFTITFKGTLTGQNVAQITNATTPTGGTTASWTTSTQGAAPAASGTGSIQARLNLIPAFTGN